jgi:hypothetical protein
MDLFKGPNVLEFVERSKTDENCKEYLANISGNKAFNV